MVELLMVLVIFLALAAITVPAVQSISSAGRLNAATRLVSNLLSLARSEAINSGTVVQLRIVTDKWETPQGDDASAHFRRLSLWKYDREAVPPGFRQFSKWETLPEGVMIDPGPDPSLSHGFPVNEDPGTYFLASHLNNTLQGVGVGMGEATANVATIEFTPRASLAFGGPAPAGVYLVLIEGMTEGAQAAPVRTRAGGANWAQVRTTSLTGRVSVTRPE